MKPKYFGTQRKTCTYSLIIALNIVLIYLKMRQHMLLPKVELLIQKNELKLIEENSE